MECVEVCLHAADYTLNRNLILQSYVILRNDEEVAYKRTQLKYYRHRTWTHLCWSYSAQTGESKYYQDGALFGTERFNVTQDDVALKASSKMKEWALIFGQEPDEMRGGFVRGQAYIGHLSGFNIWSYPLDDKDIGDMASCLTQIKGNVVAWEKTSLKNKNAIYPKRVA